MPCSDIPIVDLMGVSFHAVREDECVDHIIRCAGRGEGGWVVTANLDHLRRLVLQRSYRELCAQATLLVADGMALVWASRVRGTPLPERVAGSDLIVSLTREAARSRIPVFFLGGNPGTADGASRILERRFPGLQVAGTCCPEPGFESLPSKLVALERLLQERSPGVVYVALGSPKQEVVIQHLRRALPSAWWMGVGISFSFLTGEVPRAPRWVQTAGLEWLHRLSQEPRRLAARYLMHGIPFALRLFLESFRSRLARPVAT